MRGGGIMGIVDADRVEFMAVLRALRKHAPPVLPVRVRLVEIPKSEGAWATSHVAEDAAGKPRYFAIRLERRAHLEVQILYLLHEWAHALAWSVEEDDHAWAWARGYQRAYEVLRRHRDG